MKNLKPIFYIGIISILIANLFSSCAPAYIPNVVNTPLLSNKGEVQVALNSASSGFDPQVAVALTDHIGIMVNGSFKNSDSDSSDNFHKHNFGEIGIGRHRKFQNVGRIEIFGGYGYGDVDIRTTYNLFGSETSNITDVIYHRGFIQSSIGFTSDFFDISFTPRFVLVHMRPKDNTFKNITKPFAEPVVSMKLGYRYFFLTSQFGLSLPLISTNNQDWFAWNPFILSFGITFKFRKIYNNQPPSYN